MERRTFIRGAFGLAALAAMGGVRSASVAGAGRSYVTPTVADPQLCPGPVMQAGIELLDEGDAVRGMYGTTHLFSVDATGAELIRLADGTMTLDQLANALPTPVDPADVAGFFVALGQAGYLANTVLVNLSENRA